MHTLTTESLRPLYPAVPAQGERPLFLVAHPRDGSVFVVDLDGSFVRVDPTSGDVLAAAPEGFVSGEDGPGVMSPDGSRMVVQR